MNIRQLFLFCFSLLLAGSAAGHEYWLQPATFFPVAKENFTVRLYVGEGLQKHRQERQYQPGKTTTFKLFTDTAVRDLKPGMKSGAAPIRALAIDGSGTALLAMARNWSYIKLDAAKFEAYLREEGMEYIIAERVKFGESGKPGRERYSRFIKSVLQVGDMQDDAYKKSTGFKLDIVPLENPYAKKIGDSLTLQILFDGKPLAKRMAFAESVAGAIQSLTSDADGKVTMTINHAGMHLVRVVVMQRCASDCGDADWESYWGALTFAAK